MQEPLTKKQRNMIKTAFMYWGEDEDAQTIAEELGLAESTIHNYLSSDEMEELRQFYSIEFKEHTKQKLKKKMEQNTAKAGQLISSAAKDQKAKPRDKIRAAKEFQNIQLRYADFLQKIGFLKEEDEHEGDGSSVSEVTFNEEIVQDRAELEEIDKEEVEK